MPLFKAKKLNISKTLSDKYIVPPFSVFNTHQSYFRERMRMWRDIGVVGNAGRNKNLAYDNRRMEKGKIDPNGTSTFNPVVCEIIYKWFARKGDIIFDPFAGGITRGGVAIFCDCGYIGYDINTKQVSVNAQQYEELADKYEVDANAIYLCVDSEKATIPEHNLFFTCPPYYNLERYTDNPNDLSNCTSYKMFLLKYKSILKRSLECLYEDSFAVIVVSDVRDKKTGEYYPLVADTTEIMIDLGLKYYNEIILYNDTGNLAITSGNYLDRARKVGRQHQNILVFYKGNTKNIKEKFGEVNINAST